MKKIVAISLSTLLTAGMVLSLPRAEAAKWFGSKKKQAEQAVEEQVRTFQPPSTDAFEMYCEPIRQEAAEISLKPAYVRFLFEPRRSWLIRQHEKCKAELMGQEFEYLKHVDIQRTHSLPKLRIEAEEPANANP